jgi:hypothetical protein
MSNTPTNHSDNRGIAMDNESFQNLALTPPPAFLPNADGSDALMVGVAICLVLLLFGIIVLYLMLHDLPERIAQRGNAAQFQAIGVLTLLALFTGNDLFWVAAILLAAFRVPDFLTPLSSIAQSLREMRDADRTSKMDSAG